jgi:bacillithiol biosynthesis cysteine-adding enzyme BshC
VPAQQVDTAIDIRRFPWIRKLAADYIFNFSGVAPFFSGNPAEKSAWADAIARAQAHPRDRKRLAEVLAAQQERRQAPARAREAAARLADGKTVALVTGQQAGLFGGPLFTLLKAITALKLAEKISREHQTDAVAVFWVEGEDHDWEEVRSCTVLDEALQPHTVGLPQHAVPEGTSIARVALDGQIAGAVDELERLLPPTEFRGALIADLRAIYAPGVGMADAFARWLERALGPRGLIVYDASDVAAKPMAAPVFSRELSSAGETIRRASAAGEGLSSRGYHSQVQAAEGGVALFRMADARRPLRQQNGGFAAGEETFTAAALVEEAARRPQGFSPNVLLRPIVQDTVFPTVAYVAGPNELAYLGQLKGVYDHFGVPMPLMYPRCSATLLDSAAVRFLQKYHVAIESLQAQDEAVLNELLQSQIPASIEESFQAAGKAMDDNLARVASALATLDPTLEGAAKSTHGKMQHDLHTLHNKMIQAAKRRDETMRRQFLRTRALAFPGGHPQERAIGFVSFLNQYGPALIDRLFDELPLDLGSHWIVSI